MDNQNLEVRGEIARLLGWRFEMDREIGPIAWISPEGHATLVDHPVPNSLDSLAAIWKEHLAGWTWTREYAPPLDDPELGMVLMWRAFHEKHGQVWINDTTNPLHDGFALTLAVMRVEKGGKA